MISAYRVRCAAAFLGFVLMAGGAHAASNLVANAGFESALGGDIGNWSSWGVHTLRTTESPFNGSGCLRLCGSNQLGGVYQHVDVTAGKLYEAGFRFRWDADWSAGQREFEIEWKRDDWTSIETNTFIVGFAGNPAIWHHSGAYPVVAPDEATHAEIRFDYNWVTPSNAYFYLDDVALEEVDSWKPGVQNGDFDRAFYPCALGNWQSSGMVARSHWQGYRDIGRSNALAAMGYYSGHHSGQARQTFAVQADASYRLSFHHARDNGFTTAVANVEIDWLGSDTQSVVGSDSFAIGLPANGAGWASFQSSMLTSHSSAAYAQIRFVFNGVGEYGTYYIDEVEFDAPRSFFRCQATNIVDGAGAPFIARGLALSGWFFPEGYMFGILKQYSKWKYLNTHTEIRNRFEALLGGEAASEAFWDTYRSNFMTAADVAMFRNEFGVNMVRFPFNYRDLSPENNPGAYRANGFADMDKVIRWCASNDIYVILDMHSCPGGASSEPSGDPEYLLDIYNDAEHRWEEHAIGCLWETNLWGYTYKTGRTPESNAQRTADLWKYIASYYRNEDHIIGYEVINEPFLPNTQWSWEVGLDPTNQMRETFKHVTGAIREVDDRHIVFVSGDWFSESIGGMLPPWETNMAIAVHRYWKETGFQDGVMQEYLDARDEHQVPFWLSESGENSNPWFYDMARLFESNNIGWTWWAWKKTGSIASGFASEIPASFQYVINNLWLDTIDTNLFRTGLYDLAQAFRTENCNKHVGYFASLFNTNGLFNVASQPFKNHVAPGTIQFADYDVGNQGVAYSDSGYWNTNFDYPVDYNLGWKYRNDGVDIGWNDADSAYKVFHTDDGEWLKYTINFQATGTYHVGIRYATEWTNRQLRLHWDDTADLSGVVTTPASGGWGTWRTHVVSNVIVPAVGVHTLKVEIVSGGIDLARMEFARANTAPIVDAGADQNVTLPANVILDGTVNDDGLPNPPGAFSSGWTKASGPGVVGFGNSNAVDTTVTFSSTGTYVLCLAAHDGELGASDTVTVAVAKVEISASPGDYSFRTRTNTAYGESLLDNGGFGQEGFYISEPGGDPVRAGEFIPAYWTWGLPDELGWCNGNVQRRNWKDHGTDGYCAIISGTWMGGTYALIGQRRPITAGRLYEAAGWFWKEPGWTAENRFKLEFMDASQVLLVAFTNNLAGVGDAWSRAVILGQAPGNAAYARVVVESLSIGADGTLYCDDLTLRAVTSSPVDEFTIEWIATTGLAYSVDYNDHPAIRTDAWVPLATNVSVVSPGACAVCDSNVAAVLCRKYRIAARLPAE